MDDTASVTSKKSVKSTVSKVSIKISKPPLPHSSKASVRSESKSATPQTLPTPKDLDLITIYKMLYSIQTDMSSLRKDVAFLKDKHAETIRERDSKCLDVKEQNLNVPTKIAMKCLEYKSIKGEMELFKYCYINEDDKVKVPITCPNLHIFKYWYNNKWNIDVEGEHIKDTLFTNFKKVYLKVNRIQNYEKFDTARFTENQKHITGKLRDATYQKKFMTALKALLKEI